MAMRTQCDWGTDVGSQQPSRGYDVDHNLLVLLPSHFRGKTEESTIHWVRSSHIYRRYLSYGLDVFKVIIILPVNGIITLSQHHQAIILIQ